MGVIDFLLFLLIAGILGGIAAGLMGVRGAGCGWYILFGFIGALVGKWLASQFGLPELLTVNAGGYPFPVVWTVLGGLVVVGLFALITRRRFVA